MRLSHYLTNVLFKPFSASSRTPPWPTLSNMSFEVMREYAKKSSEKSSFATSGIVS